jgi:hypothetical protein
VYIAYRDRHIVKVKNTDALNRTKEHVKMQVACGKDIVYINVNNTFVVYLKNAEAVDLLAAIERYLASEEENAIKKCGG